MVINEALQNFAYLSQPADECGLKSPPKNKNSNLLRFLRLSQKQIAIQNLHNLTYFCWSRTIPRRIMLRGVSRRRIFYHQFQICFLVDLILTSIQSGEVIPPVAFIAKGPRPPYPIFDSLLVRDDSDNVAFLIPWRRKSRGLWINQCCSNKLLQIHFASESRFRFISSYWLQLLEFRNVVDL